MDINCIERCKNQKNGKCMLLDLSKNLGTNNIGLNKNCKNI